MKILYFIQIKIEFWSDKIFNNSKLEEIDIMSKSFFIKVNQSVKFDQYLEKNRILNE